MLTGRTGQSRVSHTSENNIYFFPQHWERTTTELALTRRPWQEEKWREHDTKERNNCNADVLNILRIVWEVLWHGLLCPFTVAMCPIPSTDQLIHENKTGTCCWVTLFKLHFTVVQTPTSTSFSVQSRDWKCETGPWADLPESDKLKHYGSVIFPATAEWWV